MVERAGPWRSVELPYLSVVVPARNCARYLRMSLTAVTASDYPRALWELIVVDDGSTDDTPLVAAEFADAIIRLSGRPRGPAYARNRGVEAARGQWVVFLDADVMLHPTALGRFVQTLAEDIGVAAVIGSFDDQPPATNLVSQYRNLLRHHLHQLTAGDVETFWSACGGIRRDAFLSTGMFDEWQFARPQIEDVELGRRLCAEGYRVVLRPDIQGTHCKTWTLSGMLAAGFRDNGIPMARYLGVRQMLFPRRLSPPHAPTGKRIWLTASSLAFVLAGVANSPNWLFGALVSTLFILLGDRSLFAFFARRRGAWFALRASVVHILAITVAVLALPCGWILRHLIGDPRQDPTVEAFFEVKVESWPPVPVRR